MPGKIALGYAPVATADATGLAHLATAGKLTSTPEGCRVLEIGIGIQSFPEAMAVCIPLRRAGMSPLKSFWYGQLSGEMVKNGELRLAKSFRSIYNLPRRIK